MISISTLLLTYYNDTKTASSTTTNSNESMRIYPNPTQDFFFVQLSNQVHDSQLKIYDVLGKEVSQQTLNKTQSEISVSHLETGIYIIEVSQGNNKFIEHIVVK